MPISTTQLIIKELYNATTEKCNLWIQIIRKYDDFIFQNNIEIVLYNFSRLEEHNLVAI